MVEHKITLQGFNFNHQSSLAAKAPPTILTRTDQEFIAGILNELKTVQGLNALKKTVNKKADENNISKLFQPVHRTYHVALFELFCEEPGVPRVDPKKIEGAGLVIRRRIETQEKGVSNTQLQGWLQAGNKIKGWVPLTKDQQVQDPDPTFRPRKLRSGNIDVDKKLALVTEPDAILTPYSETFSPLFVAPPEVCEAAKKTILYALVPVTSNAISEAEVNFPGYGSTTFSKTDPVFRHMSKLLTQTLKTKDYVWTNQEITRAALDSGLASATKTISDDWESLIACLEQLLIEFDAFGDSKQSTSLFKTLNLIQLPYKDSKGVIFYKSAGDIFKQATELLVHRSDTITKLKMPIYWPQVDEKIQISIWQAATASLTSRAEQISPGIGRYDELENHYQLEAFVRVKQQDQCPPKLVWSSPSAAFTIAPWYESGDLPPVRISLPDVTDKNFLSKLKPSVAFAMPESLFNSMKGAKLDSLMDGKKPSGGPSIGLGWICGFNIPIITFCAFFVLSIFLSLLNFIFQWLLFVKICIPFPVKK